jgi:hypothetical protein
MNSFNSSQPTVLNTTRGTSVSPRSGRKHKAWGGNPRIAWILISLEPATRATDRESKRLPPAPRARSHSSTPTSAVRFTDFVHIFAGDPSDESVGYFSASSPSGPSAVRGADESIKPGVATQDRVDIKFLEARDAGDRGFHKKNLRCAEERGKPTFPTPS